jgi:hypothetical protein
MLRKPRTAAVAALVVLALATASHRVAAQDTSQARQVPQDTAAYTGGVSRDTTDTTLRTSVERIDTTARPGQGAGTGDTAAATDTSAIQRVQPSAGDSTDTTKVGETKPHRIKHAHSRLHPARYASHGRDFIA